MHNRTILPVLALALCLSAGTQAQSFDPLTVTSEEIGFNAYPNGDRVPDYSFAGYMSGESIPDVLSDTSIPVVKIEAKGPREDMTFEIQSAIDYVSSLPLRADGFRGVVLLKEGEFNIRGSLKISSSGVVLRGSGKKTVLLASGTSRETAIRIEGCDDRVYSGPYEVTAEYVPVGSVTLPLKAGHTFKEGDMVRITRPCTQEWIELLGAQRIGDYADYDLPSWKPGDAALNFDRIVVESGSDYIVVDVPLPQGFDRKYGPAMVRSFAWQGRVSKSAVENLVLRSSYNLRYPKDEDHRWMAVSVDNAVDCWVRRVDAEHFVSSAVYVQGGASRVTVEECRSLSPVGEIGGYRRIAFQTDGQQTMFNRCYSEQAYHAFAVGQSACGPNVFMQCYAADSYDFSGALGLWSCGTLFDRVTVENEPIKFSYLDLDLQGGGYASANSMCWQCRAPQIHLTDPPGAHNWAYGSRGQGYGLGAHGNHKLTKPEFFYWTQYAARKGEAPQAELDKWIRYNPEFSQTDAAFARRESLRSRQAATTIDAWIDSLVVAYPLANDGGSVLAWKAPERAAEAAAAEHPLVLERGLISRDGSYLAGRAQRTALWRGSLRARDVASASDHLTRFVPGRTGRGFTDDLEDVRTNIAQAGTAVFSHFPALWYERRRDDHGRLTRADADVWAPFYEQPFARSGQGEASDRLSKYDLDRWNLWYWSRINEFAQIADEQGIAFVHEHYLQHNIIEEGAHWIDYPWRSENNINDLGFKEPTYMQGDKRVFMAEEFYNLDNEKLMRYHRRYINKSLDEAAHSSNTIHHIGAEYTGPLHFMKVWLDCVRNWEIKNNKDVIVALNATHDVAEAILGHPLYSRVVDVIDVRQWHYRDDGSLYAPEGGVSLAPRQYARIMDVGTTGPAEAWKVVREYRTRFPQKAVWLNSSKGPGSNWVAFIAGASLCNLPSVKAPKFFDNALKMNPMDDTRWSENSWSTGAPGVGYIAYTTDAQITLSLPGDNRSYRSQWIDPASGEQIGKSVRVKSGDVIKVPAEAAVLYLYR
ncbi:MAG: pectate lyase [Bacteroidales bacterium]|nr:pectate lyase [Bacteroidales bacterium]